jgi:hypothetical protein
MQFIDVCNGDADGLIARHQFRLSYPVPHGQLTLITGPKREVTLLARVDMGAARAGAEISVFDISYDQNAASVRRLLGAGATMRYFDHHRANQLQTHPRLDAHIDTSARTCTSLIVDRYLNAAHRPWAIAAAFGDNLAEVAEAMATEANLPPADTLLLRQLGEFINYNAYGESSDDLHYPPAEIAERMAAYADPREFVRCEQVLPRLLEGFTADLRLAEAVIPAHASQAAAAYILPEEPWARRISGTFANVLTRNHPHRAHAVLSCAAHGGYTVSIRAPADRPTGADAIAAEFTGGGGRAAAAGINNLPRHETARLIELLEAAYRASSI